MKALPLFLVQTVQAANLAVTALLPIPVLRIRIKVSEWLAIASVGADVLLLMMSVYPQKARRDRVDPSVGDNAIGTVLLDEATARHPALAKTWVDVGYKNTVMEYGATLGIDVEAVTKDSAVKGFR